MEELEVVKIVSDRQPSGFVIINKTDFDESRHELYGAKKQDKEEKAEDKPKRAYTRKE